MVTFRCSFDGLDLFHHLAPNLLILVRELAGLLGGVDQGASSRKVCCLEDDALEIARGASISGKVVGEGIWHNRFHLCDEGLDLASIKSASAVLNGHMHRVPVLDFLRLWR